MNKRGRIVKIRPVVFVLVVYNTVKGEGVSFALNFMVMMTQRIKAGLLESAEVKQKMANVSIEVIEQMVRAIIGVLRSGGKVLLCGNGGSAADCQHFAGELVGRFVLNRPGLPVIALTTDSSVLTCVANDFSYEDVFARQVEAIGRYGDLLIAFSTSGNSPNILKAVEVARSRGIKTLGMTGGSGGCLSTSTDLSLIVPSDKTSLIQEGHIAAYHLICELVEEMLFK